MRFAPEKHFVQQRVRTEVLDRTCASELEGGCAGQHGRRNTAAHVQSIGAEQGMIRLCPNLLP